MKYSYFRYKNCPGFGFKNKENRYCMVRNNQNNEWFAVYEGESVSAKDNKECYFIGYKKYSFPDNIRIGAWVQYKRRPKQIKS